MREWLGQNAKLERPTNEREPEADSDRRTNTSVAFEARQVRGSQPVQAKGIDASSPAYASAPPPPSSPGQTLPAPLATKMGGALGADFSTVRIHNDGAAEAIGARAFTRGNDIHMAPGEYRLDTADGQDLLGHELTHVVQQRQGRVAAPQGKDAAVNADPHLEAEADELGARAARGETGRVTQTTSTTTTPTGAVQCRIGSRKRNAKYEKGLTLDIDGQLAELAKLIKSGKKDHHSFNRTADCLGGLAAGASSAELDNRFETVCPGKGGIGAALVTVWSGERWRSQYLLNVLHNGEPTPIDKLALLLGLVTHGKGSRAVFRPGDYKNVLKTLEGEFPAGDLWKLFNLPEYKAFRTAFTQLERIDDMVATRIHALRRSRGVVVPTAPAKPDGLRNVVPSEQSAANRLIAAITAKAPRPDKLASAASEYIGAISVGYPDDEKRREAVDFKSAQFVSKLAFSLPSNPARLKAALKHPKCAYPILEAIADRIRGVTKKPPAYEVEHLASIVRHRGGHGVVRAFKKVKTAELVEDVKAWRAKASVEACELAVQDGSAFREALSKIRSRGPIRGLSAQSKKMLIALVADGANATAAPTGASEDEVKKHEKTQAASASANELHARIEREQTKTKGHIRARGRLIRMQHTGLKGHIDGMNAQARQAYLLNHHLEQAERDEFKNPQTEPSRRRELFAQAVEALDGELEQAHLNRKERASIRAKFIYTGDVGVNYLRLVEIAAKYPNDHGDVLGKKVYSAVTKLAGDEYLQVRRDPTVVRLLERTGSYKNDIRSILGLGTGDAYDELEGSTETERAASARKLAEEQPIHWAKLISYEVDKHSLAGGREQKGKLANVFTVHVGRLYSMCQRAQMAAARAHPDNVGQQQHFTARVMGLLSEPARRFLRKDKTPGMGAELRRLYESMITGRKIQFIDRIQVADRGIHTRSGEMQDALDDLSGTDLLYQLSNFSELQALVERRANAPQNEKPGIDQQIAKFTLDIKPEVHDSLTRHLSESITNKPKRLVALVAAARRKLAEALADDDSFRRKLVAAYASAGHTDRVDGVVSARLRAMATYPEEELRKKGFGWRFLTALGDATTLKFSELKGAHRTMGVHVGEFEQNRANNTTSREEAVKGDIKKIKGLESDYKGLAADFEALRAKYNQRLRKIIEILVGAALSAATAGIGGAITAAAGAAIWWANALVSVGASVVQKTLSIIVDAALEGGFDKQTGDWVKDGILFGMEQGITFATAYCNSLLKVEWKKWMESAGLGSESVTEPGKWAANVTYDKATVAGHGRLAADAGLSAAKGFSKAVVFGLPKKLVTEMVTQEDPMRGLRTNGGREALNFTLGQVKDAAYTFASTLATSEVTNEVTRESQQAVLDEKNAMAKLDAEGKQFGYAKETFYSTEYAQHKANAKTLKTEASGVSLAYSSTGDQAIGRTLGEGKSRLLDPLKVGPRSQLSGRDEDRDEVDGSGRTPGVMLTRARQVRAALDERIEQTDGATGLGDLPQQARALKPGLDAIVKRAHMVFRSEGTGFAATEEQKRRTYASLVAILDSVTQLVDDIDARRAAAPPKKQGV